MESIPAACLEATSRVNSISAKNKNDFYQTFYTAVTFGSTKEHQMQRMASRVRTVLGAMELGRSNLVKDESVSL